MKIFLSYDHAIAWIDRAEGLPAISDRVHGSLSFLAYDRKGRVERYTCGAGMIARANEWRPR